MRRILCLFLCWLLLAPTLLAQDSISRAGASVKVNADGSVTVTTANGKALKVPTATADPAGSNALTYYNTSTNKFRCYEGGAWKDCISTGAVPGGSSGQLQYNNAGTLAGFTLAGDCTFSVPNITCTKSNGVSFGSNAFTSTAYAPLASPTFTGTPSGPSFSFGGAGGLGFAEFSPQSSAPTAPAANYLREYANSTGLRCYIRSSGFSACFDSTGITASRNFVFPDAAGTFVLDSNTQTVTGKTLRGPDGTASAPTFSFSNNTGTGLYNISGVAAFAVNGTRTFSVTANGPQVNANALIFDSLSNGTTAPRLIDEAAGTLALRNSTNAQTFRWYSTFTDTSNYKRGEMGTDGNGPYIQGVGAGTGGSTNFSVLGQATLFLGGGGGAKWSINSSGHLLAQIDNTYDVGASGANCPRALYVATTGTFGGNVTANAFLAGGVATAYDSNNDLKLNSTGVVGWTSGALSLTKDTGLTRSSAGIVKVTDGSTGTGRLMTIGIRTGTSSNTDLDGQLTLSAGTASYTFAGTYTSTPICVVSNTSAATTAPQVTVTTTTLTITGSGTDVYNYICHGRN